MSGIELSLCRYVNGEFDLFIVDKETRQEVAISGTRKFTEAEVEMLDRLMPGCVFTSYRQA